MFGRLCLCLAVLGALAVAPAAAGDGPMFVAQGGSGVVSRSGHLRYVAVGVSNKTVLEAIQTSDGSVARWLDLSGSWGIPSVGYPATGEGLSRNGRMLVLGPAQPATAPSSFLVVDPQRMTVVKRITLPGTFSYDALSPDGSRLYLIQFVNGDLQHYVVRAYDLRDDRLLPGRIADRTQKDWVMQGYPVVRTASADGRWVYTLYSNPGGYPFVHALDTVRGVAHCVGLPLTNQNTIYQARLSLHGGVLAVRPWFDVDTTTWHVSTPGHRASFPWWTLAFPAVVPLAAVAAFLWKRRRRPQDLDQELAGLLRAEPPERRVAV